MCNRLSEAQALLNEIEELSKISLVQIDDNQFERLHQIFLKAVQAGAILEFSVQPVLEQIEQTQAA